MPNLPDISVWATPLYLVLIGIEVMLVNRSRIRGLYDRRDAFTSVALGTGSVLIGLLLAASVGVAIMATYDWVYQHHWLELPLAWWTFALCFVLDDLRYYWSHRLSHQIRWCWASHVVHHSSQHFNLTTALRQPWLGPLTGLFVLNLPLIAIGFHPALVVFAASLNLFYQFFIHTEAIDQLPRPIEAVFNTPSHHRVHHGRNLRYLDANYAGVLIVWDKLFGTFVPELPAEPVRYGLVKNIHTFNPLRAALHGYAELFRDQWQPGLGWRARLGYLFAPPGWSHDGSRQLTIERKRQRLRDRPELAGQPGFSPSLLLD